MQAWFVFQAVLPFDKGLFSSYGVILLTCEGGLTSQHAVLLLIVGLTTVSVNVIITPSASANCVSFKRSY